MLCVCVSVLCVCVCSDCKDPEAKFTLTSMNSKIIDKSPDDMAARQAVCVCVSVCVCVHVLWPCNSLFSSEWICASVARAHGDQ